jgi:hypothetical protein
MKVASPRLPIQGDRTVRPLLVLPLALIVASSAAAAPSFRYTWGPANAMVFNQDFTGPATYAQTLSVTGLSGSVSSFSVEILHAFHGPGSAWHAINPVEMTVSPPQADCEGDPGYSVTTAVAGAISIPGAVANVQIVCGPASVTRPGTTCHSHIHVTFDPPFVADPDTRYGMLTLEFHHQNSTAGESGDACDFADQPMCWVQAVPASASVNGVNLILPSEGGLLSWQNAPQVVDCWRAVTPTRPSSWGSIKTLYR